MRRSVAVAGCRATPGGPVDVLYPDEDWPLLRHALEAAGFNATLLAWDAPGVDWTAYDALLVRSTWDSVDRPREFLEWARQASAATVLLNPFPLIAWNLDKAYLRRLATRGVPVVPTLWLTSPDQRLEPGPLHDFVVKPSISGGARQTARYTPAQIDAARAHVGRLIAVGHTVMVQDYVPSVDVEGETRLVCVGGRFTHAVRVGPRLVAGEAVPHQPWTRPVRHDPTEPAPAQLALTQAVLEAIRAEVPSSEPPLYARVDVVSSATGDPLLLEVELVDPSLLLRLVPEAADALAASLSARL